MEFILLIVSAFFEDVAAKSARGFRRLLRPKDAKNETTSKRDCWDFPGRKCASGDQIVDFSGLEQFIDVPVKNYSSGMYVRLAFSVAAHLNPEIVILDEVLAVGDAVFQKKCFDRMEEIINEGHAAILVSHGMGNVRRMSQVCMWLHHGRVQMFGPTHDVVAQYEKQTTHDVVSELEKKTAQAQELSQPEPIARLDRWSVESKLMTNAHTIYAGGAAVTFRFQIELRLPVPNGKITVSLTDAQGLLLCSQNGALRQVKVGKIWLGLELPLLPLNPGEYILSCTISDGIHPLAFLRATPELTVLEEKNAQNTGYYGVLNLPTRLSVEERKS
jgi:ABC-2 type transport system ATP-binding protein